MGWNERQYDQRYQTPYVPRPDRPVGTYWIVGVTVALQAAVWLFLGPAHSQNANEWGQLSDQVFRSGQIWRLVTYLILHGSGMHLFFNMLMVYVVGSFLEPRMGTVQLVRLYIVFGVVAALGYFVTPSAWDGIPCIGASGAAMGFVAYFGTRFPKVQMMIWGIFPMAAWALASLLVIVDLLGAFSSEGGGTAHTVHLGGALAGFFTAYAIPRLAVLQEQRRMQQMHADRAAAQQLEAEDRYELDRLLEKIHKGGGLQVLTESERDFLRNQSSKLKSRS